VSTPLTGALGSHGTLAGAGAILLWSTLALLTTGADAIPPFQLLAMTFALGSGLGFALSAAGGRRPVQALAARPMAGLLALVGLFLYHAFYFAALKAAPPAEASLISYLWPALMVVLAGCLPGERLRPRALAGTGIAFAGAALLVVGEAGLGFEARHAQGYLAALACALIWSAYSVANRAYRDAPTEILAPVCAAVAVLAALCSVLLEAPVLPGAVQWGAILALGLGPVGAAFFLWDHGTKHGNLSMLGVLAYAAPLLSTLLLVAAGRAEAGWRLALACALIVGGAVLAAPRRRA